MADSSRPLLITIIGILVALVGLLTLLGGIAALAVDGIIGGISIVIGIINIVIAFGMLKGVTIMWYLGLIFEGIGVITNLISVIGGDFGAIISLVIALVIIYYLFRPAVKSWFKV